MALQRLARALWLFLPLLLAQGARLRGGSEGGTCDAAGAPSEYGGGIVRAPIAPASRALPGRPLPCA